MRYVHRYTTGDPVHLKIYLHTVLLAIIGTHKVKLHNMKYQLKNINHVQKNL